MSRFKLPPLGSAAPARSIREAAPVAAIIAAPILSAIDRTGGLILDVELYCDACQGFGYTRKGADTGWIYCTACRGAQRRLRADYKVR